jgi:sugar phosphate isomerase/epimerase
VPAINPARDPLERVAHLLATHDLDGDELAALVAEYNGDLAALVDTAGWLAAREPERNARNLKTIVSLAFALGVEVGRAPASIPAAFAEWGAGENL